MSIIYGFYDFMYTRRIKPSVFAVHIGLAVFCSVLAQSRTHIILSVIGCLFILLLRVKKLNVITFWRILFVIGIGIVAMILFFNSGNPLAERLLSMDIASDTETTASRVWQWMYNIEKIKQSFMGYGFGSRMYFLSSATTLVTNSVSYYVDNAILTVLYKGGWLYGIVYLSYVVRTALKLWTTYRKKRDNESLIALMIFAMLILALMIMSCQITHTYATNAVMWTFIGLVIRQKIYISEMYYNRVVFIIKIATK